MSIKSRAIKTAKHLLKNREEKQTEIFLEHKVSYSFHDRVSMFTSTIERFYVLLLDTHGLASCTSMRRKILSRLIDKEKIFNIKTIK